MRRRNRRCGLCVFAAVLLFLGVVCLCCLSYKFILFLIAGLLVVVGIVLIKRC